MGAKRTDSVALEKAHHYFFSTRRPNDFELTIFLSKIKYSKALFLKIHLKFKCLFLEASELCQDAVLSHKDFHY
ncbi:MAG: hypothetical protein CM15mP4_2700 [Candidatus Neomarinimicrobiota bacterium]|nr:MAG: hypothetical protein CM15mP4_2700 [Candidatus Neomarinimicrobiota bacterium]